MAVNQVDWAHDQLDKAGYELHGPHRKMRPIVDAALDAADMVKADEEDVTLALQLLDKLMHGHPLVVEEEPRPGRWVPFELGDFGAGTRVRVKSDAYGSGIGERFNGRLGHFSAARNGQALVTFDDESGNEFASRHLPSKLEAYVFE